MRYDANKTGKENSAHRRVLYTLNTVCAVVGVYFMRQDMIGLS